MPRITKLTIEQIDEFLEDRASENTILALKTFLRAEKQRRIDAGNLGGRPVTVTDKKLAKKNTQAKWRKKQKFK